MPLLDELAQQYRARRLSREQARKIPDLIVSTLDAAATLLEHRVIAQGKDAMNENRRFNVVAASDLTAEDMDVVIQMKICPLCGRETKTGNTGISDVLSLSRRVAARRASMR